ncbi:MAG TPA: hypothetical protein VK909_13150 [Anaerolineales bacterium]|nr:hypothetical protein [Anaerolineales bacterium]
MNRMRGVIKIVAKWFSIPWYFLVFSAYPILALLAFNVGQVKVVSGWRPFVLSILFSGLLFLPLQLFLRNAYRAAFLTTLWLALFFSYGHIYLKLAEKWGKINLTPYMLTAWFVLAVLFAVWVTRPRFAFRDAALALNVVALGLVITSLVQLNSSVPKRNGHYVAAKNAPLQNLTRPQNPPDVYYFILDMYTRADLLKQAYNYDNSSFIHDLESRGFYVAQCSQSNYTRTEISLTSSLNLSYLQGLDPKFDDPQSISRTKLWDALKHNAVRYQLESLGYKTISFANGFAWSEWDDADLFLTPPPFSSGITEFEILFMQTTLARTIEDFGWLDFDQISGQNFRDRDMTVFHSMKRIAKMPGPKFVYTHMIMPHPPFVFGPQGEYTDPAEFWNDKKQYPAGKFERGYTNQVTFLNHQLLDMIDTILAESKTPPIIILQGDHGPWLQPNPQHFFILNAYYLPDHNDQLYPQMSPVNSFRYIFNSYFGGKYNMLPDITYFSPVPKLYNFSVVENPCRK